MKNLDSEGHVTGKSVFLDDIPLLRSTMFAVPSGSEIAHGCIKEIDISDALAAPGVETVLTWKDIPGENQIGGILADEPLLSSGKVDFASQPLAIVVARSERLARMGVKLIRVEYEQQKPVTDAREAHRLGQFLFPPRTFTLGDIRAAWPECRYIFEGKSDSGAQEHVYLETQGAYVWISENGNLTVHSATQGPTQVQKAVAKVLGIPMNRVEVDVRRLGGGFGGKEDQATAWAVMAALAAHKTGKPVKLVLSRHDDLYMTGKRHPYSADFRIGLSKELKILAWEVTWYQNGGAAADLSPAILERTLLHSTNSYYIPNVKATAFSCRTNLPPNTAFRGFGAPQAMFAIESAISLAADKLGIPASRIQEKNLLADNDLFPYGQKTENAHAIRCWEEVKHFYRVEDRINEIKAFNRSNLFYRKGISMMPVCFGISFTNTSMNRAQALVHIYQDGSIGISTGAVEMGQGVNTRLIQVAAQAFSVHPDRIKPETTNTSRVANTSPTAASSGADLNGKALQVACTALTERLKQKAAQLTGSEAASITILNEKILNKGEDTGITWESLIRTALLDRINLSQTGHYATPVIWFDKKTEKGHPFAYHVFGTAVTVVTLDCLRGEYSVDSVQIVHDSGANMNRELDMAQIEGAVVQGIGWMTMEEIRFDENGKLLSNSLSNYKIPDVFSAPKQFDCIFLQTEGPQMALSGSKAIGEPPFMYGIGTWFALLDAMKAFKPDLQPVYDAPLTPEKVLLMLYKP
jgi:xanthine dehydrogenase large subunit